MSIDPALRSLNVTLPASPGALVLLSALMDKEDVTVGEVAQVVETDLALAAAVVRTVNSAMFGVLSRVETVNEAVQYLGMREVAALTYEMGLRSRFAPVPLLQALWQRARLRGLLMGRVASACSVHAWRAHSCGLFAEAGQAVLFAHAPERCEQMYASLRSDATAAELAALEREAFGVDHAVLGASLCRSWGLAADVADAVHDRISPSDDWKRRSPTVRMMLCLGALVDHVLPTVAPGATSPPLPPGVALALKDLGQDMVGLEATIERHRQRLADAGAVDAMSPGS